MKITRQQTQLLDFIVSYVSRTGGVSPSIREIRSECRMSSERVLNLLAELEKIGVLRRLKHRHRAIEVNLPPCIGWLRFDDVTKTLTPWGRE